MFGKRTVPARVVVAGEDQRPLAFPSLALNGSPISAVRKALRVAQEEHDQKIKAFDRTLSSIRAAWNKVHVELGEAREAVARDYNELRPKRDSEEYATRDPLEGLSKARAAKTRADAAYKQAYASRIEPLEAELARLKQEQSNVQASLSSLQANLADHFFNALPTPPAAQWKTDSEGKQTLEIPPGEPWCIWAEKSHRVATAVVSDWVIDPSTGRRRSVSRGGEYRTTVYRWMLVVPDALDDTGGLCFDETNTYDGTVASRIAPLSEEPIIRRD